MKKNSSYISYKLLNRNAMLNQKKNNHLRANSSLSQKNFHQKENKELNNSLLYQKRKYRLPPVQNINLNNSTYDMINSSNSFQLNNNKKDYSIEKEQLLEQTMRYKNKLKKLKQELFNIRNENLRKQDEVNFQDSQIERIIRENEEEIPLNQENYIQEDNKNTKINLRKKINLQLKEVNNQLNNEKTKFYGYERDIKLTKKKEILIENMIIEHQIEKICSLLNNSIDYQENQKKNLIDFESLETNLNNQKKIIVALYDNHKTINQKESELQNQIEELKIKLLNQNNYLKKIIDTEEKVKNHNSLLQKEKMNLLNRDDKKYPFSLLLYEKKISFLKSECSFYKKLVNKNEKIIKESQNFLSGNPYCEKIEEKSKKIIIKNSSKNNLSNNLEKEKEKIKQLKELLMKNKKKENELEQKVLLYQESLKKLNTNYEEFLSSSFDNENSTNNFDLKFKSDNPYYSSNSINDPLKTKSFTNEQFNQFTYVLFKNFESKKINSEKAKNEIIDKIFDKDNLSIEEMVNKFIKTVSLLLNCDNKNDIIRMEIFFGAICNDKNGDVKKICDYFINLFNYIQFYSDEYEKNLIDKIKNKYKEQFIIIYQNIIDFVEKRDDDDNKDYISLIEIKIILDNLPNLNIKDKYIEYLFYHMKQFNNPQQSLFDLKISKLEEFIDKETISSIKEKKKESKENNIKKNKENENKENNILLNPSEKKQFPKSADDKANYEDEDSYEEISKEDYEKAINETLIIIKLIMEKEKKNCFQVFDDSIVKISQPECDIITIDSFNDELVKRGINLNELQLSCICNKYCINEDLKALNIHQINSDIQKIDKIISEEKNKINDNFSDINDKFSSNSIDNFLGNRKNTS